MLHLKNGAIFFCLFLVSCFSYGENGVTATEVLIGTATNLEGSTAGVAEEFNAGITAYFEKVNRAGGVYGRKFIRKIYSDGYEPKRTKIETLKLIDEDRVFALMGYASTPGTTAILPLLNEKKIPLIAPYTGAEVLRNPDEKYVFNIKAGYPDQTKALIRMGVYSLGAKEVCVFYQNDELGNAGKVAADTTLKKYNLSLHAQASYERNSMDVAGAVKILKDAGCKAILMSGQDRQATLFVELANKADFHPIFLCLNLIGTGEFLRRVKDLKENIFIAVVTPLPTEMAYPIVQEFVKEIKNLNPKASVSPNTFEGYLVGAIFEKVLQKTGKDLTREKFSKIFEKLKDENIGGINFTFNKSNRQATNRVLVAKVTNGVLQLP